ncbi:MAG: peptidoglycan DD-metalloendopeptidase family protein [Rhizobiaceae bacterium]
MRSNILARRFGVLSKTSAFVILAASVTACSNDAMRLDTMTTASITGTSDTTVGNTGNQRQIIDGQTAQLVEQGVRPDAYGTEYAANQGEIKVIKRGTQATSSSSVSRSQLPPAQATSAQPIVLEPRQDQLSAQISANTDRITTSSVSTQTAANQSAGWDKSKGTWISVKSGETLYNLSRRYGVPVNAIMSANNLASADSVTAGSRILIPTYSYSSSTPVSAPDSDPMTKAARATTGFQGQAGGTVAVPKSRGTLLSEPAPVPVNNVASLSANPQNIHTVQSGDTLLGLARSNGISMAAIRTANNMDSDVVRLGQKLVIPSKGSTAPTAIDTRTTGSIPTPSNKPKSVKSAQSETTTTVASMSNRSSDATKPVKSSVSSFRWPADGRVISNFGERSSSGTNDGIDISMPVGTPIKASQKGTVIYAGSELEDFGNLILVSHANGWVSAYAHASSNLVKRGQKVERGQVIAKSGKSGNAQVPKLHFELRKDSTPVNPLKHLAR